MPRRFRSRRRAGENERERGTLSPSGSQASAMRLVLVGVGRSSSTARRRSAPDPAFPSGAWRRATHTLRSTHRASVIRRVAGSRVTPSTRAATFTVADDGELQPPAATHRAHGTGPEFTPTPISPHPRTAAPRAAMRGPPPRASAAFRHPERTQQAIPHELVRVEELVEEVRRLACAGPVGKARIAIPSSVASTSTPSSASPRQHRSATSGSRSCQGPAQALALGEAVEHLVEAAGQGAQLVTRGTGTRTSRSPSFTLVVASRRSSPAQALTWSPAR